MVPKNPGNAASTINAGAASFFAEGTIEPATSTASNNARAARMAIDGLALYQCLTPPKIGVVVVESSAIGKIAVNKSRKSSFDHERNAREKATASPIAPRNNSGEGKVSAVITHGKCQGNGGRT